MRRWGIVAALNLAAILWGQTNAAAADDITIVGEGQTTAVCNVAGLLVQEGLLTIRCAEPTADGISQFAVDRSTRRFDDIRDFAAYAQDKGRPLAILYYSESGRNPRGCAIDNCRQALGVERR